MCIRDSSPSGRWPIRCATRSPGGRQFPRRDARSRGSQFPPRLKPRRSPTGTRSKDSCRGGAPGGAPGEETSAEEGAFERAIAVHAAATKARDLAGAIQSRHRLSVGAQDARIQICRETAQCLPRQNREANGDERARVSVEKTMRFRRANQTVADEAARVADRHQLRVLRCLLYTSDAADERSSVDLGG